MIKAIIKSIFFIPVGYFSTLLTWVLSPLIALFYYHEERTDVVKRFDKNIVTMPRQYICKFLSWFSTDDNAADEYFWGYYGFSQSWSINEYLTSLWKQYIVRVAWLCRNPAYKFNRDILGFERLEGCIETRDIWYGFERILWTNPNGSKAFNIKGKLNFKPFRDINFGWKAHKGINNLMFADRIITFKS
jgi:hypothetical protein